MTLKSRRRRVVSDLRKRVVGCSKPFGTCAVEEMSREISAGRLDLNRRRRRRRRIGRLRDVVQATGPAAPERGPFLRRRGRQRLPDGCRKPRPPRRRRPGGHGPRQGRRARWFRLII